MMLAVTAGAFLIVAWIAVKGLFFLLDESPTFERVGETDSGLARPLGFIKTVCSD
jgi:hypothetical protein